MNIKKEWVYKQKGLRNALISVDSLILNGKLIFAISYDKNGLFESQLIALDLHTREETVILKIPHVMRKVPIRSDGYLYVNAFDANMYCIDEQSFSVKWVEKFGKGNPNWGVEVSESYVMSNNHEDLFFFDKVTGEIVYKYTLPHKYSYPKSITDMVVDGNYLYHAVKEFNGEKVHSYLYCLDFKKQKMIWTLDMQVSFCSCMRIGDILVASTSLHTYLLCPRSGEEICVFPVGGQLYKTFILDKPILYIISNDKIICLDGLLEHTLNECWRYQASDAVESSIVVYNNCVWISSKDNIIHGLDCVTGSLKIKKKTSSFPRNFTIADDKLIALSDKGQVVCYSM